MSHILKFGILGIFHNFCCIKVFDRNIQVLKNRPFFNQLLSTQILKQLASLAMLNKTFLAIFKHCVANVSLSFLTSKMPSGKFNFLLLRSPHRDKNTTQSSSISRVVVYLKLEYHHAMRENKVQNFNFFFSRLLPFAESRSKIDKFSSQFSTRLDCFMSRQM